MKFKSGYQFWNIEWGKAPLSLSHMLKGCPPLRMGLNVNGRGWMPIELTLPLCQFYCSLIHPSIHPTIQIRFLSNIIQFFFLMLIVCPVLFFFFVLISSTIPKLAYKCWTLWSLDRIALQTPKLELRPSNNRFLSLVLPRFPSSR